MFCRLCKARFSWSLAKQNFPNFITFHFSSPLKKEIFRRNFVVHFNCLAVIFPVQRVIHSNPHLNTLPERDHKNDANNVTSMFQKALITELLPPTIPPLHNSNKTYTLSKLRPITTPLCFTSNSLPLHGHSRSPAQPA